MKRLTISYLTIAVLLLTSISATAQRLPQGTARLFTVNLTPDGQANMVAYLPERPTGRAIVDLPGGAYSHLASEHEGHDWASFFNQQGIAFFVVTYRMPHGDRNIPMADARNAMLTVRDSAAVWNVNPRDVGIMGFSAGGHLASTISTHEPFASRPDFSILMYPVISMNEKETNGTSVHNFLGEEGCRDPKLIALYSNDKQVQSHLTPPALIITAHDDTGVYPLTNGLAYYAAMRRAGNECAMHIYPSGGHGFGFRSEFRYHVQMLNDMTAWLQQLPAPRQGAVRVACIGNSITYGSTIDMVAVNSYPAQMQKLLGSGYDVMNFGLSGRTLLNHGDFPYMKEKAWSDVLVFQPDVVVVKLGTNDSKPQNWAFKNEFATDLQLMIDQLRTLPSQPRILLCTPIPAFKEQWGINEDVIAQEIIPAIHKVAKKNKLTVIDLHSAITNENLISEDKIHPNKRGARKMAEVIAPYISRR